MTLLYHAYDYSLDRSTKRQTIPKQGACTGENRGLDYCAEAENCAEHVRESLAGREDIRIGKIINKYLSCLSDILGQPGSHHLQEGITPKERRGEEVHQGERGEDRW